MIRPSARVVALLFAVFVAGCDQSDLSSKATPDKADVSPAPNKQDVVAELESKVSAGDAEAMVALGTRLRLGTGITRDSERALELFLRAAKAGSADGLAEAGNMMLQGDGVAKDERRGIELIQKAHAASSRRGTLILANALMLGTGLNPDRAEAVRLLKPLAAAKFEKSKGQLAIAYYLMAHDEPDATRKEELFKLGLGAATEGSDAGDPGATRMLANVYKHGLGVTPDPRKAFQLFERAAESGDTYSMYLMAQQVRAGDGIRQDYVRARQLFIGATADAGRRMGGYSAEALSTLGWMTAKGEGTAADPMVAYAWAILARENGAPADLPALEKRLTAEQVEKAQRLAAAWRPGTDIVNLTVAAPRTGTAVVISPEGHALSNAHVVAGCSQIRNQRGQEAVLVATDSINDLAVIRFPDAPQREYVRLEAEGAQPRVGDDVLVFGFPLVEALASTGNLTSGVVSARAGLGNNTSRIQITAPVQPGSSGSPVLNRRGHLVGIVVSGMDSLKMVEATGQVGQNLNFALSLDTTVRFLEANGVPFERARSGWFTGGDESSAVIAESAAHWTLMVTCIPQIGP